MANFKWLRNPKLANGLTTTYVSHRGNDTTGDGTATNPYKTIAKATSEATAGTNIMLDDGIWEQQRTSNGRAFKWWGNGMTWLKGDSIEMTIYVYDTFYFLKITSLSCPADFYYCYCENIYAAFFYSLKLEFCIVKNSLLLYGGFFRGINNCILYYCETTGLKHPTNINTFYNNIIIGNDPGFTGIFADYNNYTTLSIPTTNGANSHSINDASTKQTVADYFNNYNLGDYTAKAGSANLGAGYKKQDIGFSLGLTFYATDSVFTEAGGATLRNVIYENECFKIAQRDKAVASATNTSVTLYTDASDVDDYYNGLIIGIIDGTGAGQMRTITDYDGTTQTATVDEWDTNPDATSRYTITGLIISAQKDFGKPYKIAKNHLFANFGYNEPSPSVWTEFVAINPLVASFGLKYSDFDDLSSKSWVYFGANGQTLYDGTYGDADDSYTFANGKPIHIRYAQLQIPLIFQFE